ncbi:MAG: DUF3618 domain-containing protein [Propionibacterium sp.]|nr:DUF3618 domain-containing protein [Propionibacterium sp.]
MSPKTGKPADTRTASQIRADIAAARTRLSNNIAGLVEEVHPTAVKGRTIDEAKNFARSEADYAKGLIRNDAGWRTDRLVIVGGALVGTVVLLLTVRAIVGKARTSR